MLGDALATIYCGGFAGEIPKDTQPDRVEVVLSWESQPSLDDVAPPAAVTSTPADASTSSPVSWLLPIKAYAQDITTDTDASADTSTDISSDTVDTAVVATSTATSTAATSTPTAAPDSNDLLDVQYSLDGKTWSDLGTVERADLSDTSFEIPISDIKGWRSLKNLQISVQSTQSVSGEPVVYLDSVGLEVDPTSRSPRFRAMR